LKILQLALSETKNIFRGRLAVIERGSSFVLQAYVIVPTNIYLVVNITSVTLRSPS
jgi:hypothetical protein